MPGASRRSPVQERSQETVHRILEAASKLLGTVPLGEVTTSLIAHEAEASIGALYRFFPDKQAIIDAIAVRHVAQFRASLENQLNQIQAADGPAFLGAVIDAFVEFLNTRPDFRTIAFGHVSPATRQREAAPDALGAGVLKRFMMETLGMTNLSELDLKLRIAIETGERLLAYAYEQPDATERAAVVEQMKHILAGYLFTSFVS